MSNIKKILIGSTQIAGYEARKDGKFDRDCFGNKYPIPEADVRIDYFDPRGSYKREGITAVLDGGTIAALDRAMRNKRVRARVVLEIVDPCSKCGDTHDETQCTAPYEVTSAYARGREDGK